MNWKHLTLGAVIALAFFTTGPALSASSAVITEFQAITTSGMQDEDGDFSDWIEVFNDSDAPVDLEGWALTDNIDRLDKWMFPALTLEAGEFVVVFASSKNRTDPAAELHTNFRLDKDGELLALIEPDGVTIASAFESFGQQVPYASYGVAMGEATELLADESTAAYHVPTDDSLGATWLTPEFDDAAWARGALALGYDTKSRPTYEHLIATDISSVMDDVNSTVYVRVPFDVADPALVDTLVLHTRYEDGMAVYLNGEEILLLNIPDEGLSWDARADSSRRDSDALVEVPLNISEHAGLLRAGANVLAVHGLNRSAGNSDFLLQLRLEAVQITGVEPGTGIYFPSPSPGWANGSGVPGIATAPTFSRESGAFVGSLELTLSSEEEGAEIRFTVDGEDPTDASFLYTEPFTIDETSEVKARVYRAGFLRSAIVPHSFIKLHSSVADVSSNLPLMIVDSFGSGISDGALVPSHTLVIDVDQATGRAKITDAAQMSNFSGIKKRGSSSLSFPKNNYAVELWDENREDVDRAVLDMPEESDWILHGPYSDKSLMRNALSYEWSNAIGRYAVRTRYVELYLNTNGGEVASNDYHGVYVLMEKIKRGSDRVDLPSQDENATTEPEITGGYIFKKDRADPGDVGFATPKYRLQYVYPKERDIRTNAAQRNYVSSWFRDFENALYGANFADPDNGYRQYIDVGSFIDHHILVELTKNIDGYRLSTFMYKEREGKLHMGPIWDYNLSLRNANYLNGSVPSGWYYPQVSAADYLWYQRLFQDPAFINEYKSRWLQIRGEVLTESYLMGAIDRDTALLNEAAGRNFVRWRTLGQYVWPNPNPLARTFQEEVDLMKSWLHDRLAWMDNELVPAPSFDHPSGIVDVGTQVEVTSPAGTIYYTLDGSDPMGANGDPSATAQLYAGPITINTNTVITARLKLESLWSEPAKAGYLTSVPQVAITEIMYNPPEPPPESEFTRSRFEFIEIANHGSEPFDVRGLQFDRLPVTYDFATSAVPVLEPGAHLVLARDLAAFRERYGDGPAVAGEYESGSLSDSGETVSLFFAGVELISFKYDDDWHPSTDGGGFSLTLADPATPWGDYEDAASWKPSSSEAGSPGSADSGQQAGLQLPGDFNQDGGRNITDGIHILQRLFGGNDSPLPCDGATMASGGNLAVFDANGDGGVNVADAVHTLLYLFGDGGPHALGTDCTPVVGCPDSCEP